jgi:D-tyrosyl-tRNA(Tyr) deacylase
MADYREILHERLYVRVPGTDKLRKTAANRQKHLLANGWRELDRQQRPDHVMVTFERTGHAPLKARLPKAAPEVRLERRPRRDDARGGGRRR